MRLLLLIILTVFTSLSLFAQQSDREKKIMALEKKQDTISRAVFLDSTEITNLKLVQHSNTRQIWRSVGKETLDIGQFYDIRLHFDTPEKALAFHQEYWKENSEFGPEIKKHKINTKGTTDFRVFKATDMINNMVAQYGLQMYCYIFVVDDYFVKFYISCKKELKPEVIQPYLNGVVKRIKK